MATKGVSCQTVLWCVIFFGTGINYMMVTNINIAIVAMVNSNGSSINDNYRDQLPTIYFNESLNISRDVHISNEVTFNWKENEQAYVLGAFYWTYWMSQVYGGSLAQRYGTKYVFGLSNLFLCLTTYLIPILSKCHLWALVSIRAIQGFIGGFCWPSLHCAVAFWVPPNKRSQFISAYMGSSVGAAVTYPLCGLIIHDLGWEDVFYITPSIGIVWFIAWWFLMFDTPADHPWISQEERTYIENSLQKSTSKTPIPIPWMDIFTSCPLWVTVFVSWGCVWGMFTLLTQAPTYFTNVHGWSIQMNGLISGIPNISRSLMAISLSFICDTLQQKELCSVLTVRKLAATVCSTIQGLFLIGLAFSGFNSIAAMICFTAALAMSGAESPGPLANYVDLSPNHAAVLYGIANMITAFAGILSPMVVGELTLNNNTPEQWQIIFLIGAAMTIIPGLLFMWLGKSEVQPWNFSENVKKDEK